MKAEKNRYDNAWKDIIRELFFEFLDFYFPELSREVDRTVPPESREKELAKLLPANQAQNRTADLLYRVRMNIGKERSLLLHIEVQNRKEEELARRLFQYAYRIFDREGSFPLTLLLLTDADPIFYPTGYRLDLGAGCNLNLDFFTRKLLYLKEELDEQGSNARDGMKNPFAFVTAAHLESLKARKPEQKYRLKLELTRRLISAGWSELFVENLLRFLDWMLQLPEELEELYDHETRSILEEEDMPYVTSWERRALKQGVELGMKQGIDLGVEKGLEQGLEQGLGQGSLKGKQDTLCRLGDKKFGGSKSEKEAFQERVSAINDESLLDRAIEAVLDAESREELMALLEG